MVDQVRPGPIGQRGGGVRIRYYYHDRSVPVFLLTAFAKNERDDLSRNELNRLAGVAKEVARTYGE